MLGRVNRYIIAIQYQKSNFDMQDIQYDLCLSILLAWLVVVNRFIMVQYPKSNLDMQDI